MKPLAQNEIDEQIRLLPDWSIVEGQLTRQFKFSDFVQSIAFVNRIAQRAEAAGHHPDIDIRYNRVSLSLMTHFVHGITLKDFDLAKAANQEFASFADGSR